MEDNSHEYEEGFEEQYLPVNINIACQNLEQVRADVASEQVSNVLVLSTPKRKRQEEEEEEEDDELTQVDERFVSTEDLPVKKIKIEPPSLPSNDELYILRFEDLKTFMERRIPPDNAEAQKYLADFKAMTPKQFAEELLERVNYLNMFGGLSLVFGRLCAQCAMKEEDFVDRSLERPDLDTAEKRKTQLTLEIIDFHTQIKELLNLAKKLSPQFWE